MLHEDAQLLVVDKPFGLATHAQEEGRQDDARSRIAAWLAASGRDAYLGIHQRLDAATSGVLLFTRQREANPALAEQFEKHLVEKKYMAVTAGAPGKRSSGELRHYIADDPAVAGRMLALPRATPRSREAITRYRVIARRADRALVELAPITGRTHQLRAQLAAAGTPIVGDPIYGGPPARRLMLHATSLVLRHPARTERVEYTSRPPSEFDEALEGHAAMPACATSFERAFREAAIRRYGLAIRADVDALRLVNGAGDGLDGVSLDVYGEHLVLSVAAEMDSSARESALDAAYALNARGVYLKVRPRVASTLIETRRADIAPHQASRGESAPAAFTIREGDLRFEVKLGDGLSTGIFLDQRDNRARLREMCRGGRALNLFAYTGGFTLAAIAGGAMSSVTVDAATPAIETAIRNIEAAGGRVGEGAHEVVRADVFDYLRRASARGDRFDVIALDPPSFATTRKSRFRAASDYAALASLCLDVLAPGGTLIACTNHRGVTKARFRRDLHDACRATGRRAAKMRDFGPPADFPAAPGEEPHLKTVVLTIEGDAPSREAVKKAASDGGRSSTARPRARSRRS